MRACSSLLQPQAAALGGRALRAPGTHRASPGLNESVALDVGQSWADFSPGQYFFVGFGRSGSPREEPRAAACAGAAVTVHFLLSKQANGHAQCMQLVSTLPPPMTRRLPGAGVNYSSSPTLLRVFATILMTVLLRGLGCRVPPALLTQPQCWGHQETPEVSAASPHALAGGIFGLAGLVPPAGPWDRRQGKPARRASLAI